MTQSPRRARHTGQKSASRSAPSDEAVTVTGQDARQGDVVLKTPSMRVIFLIGLAGAVIVVLLLRFYLLLGH